VRLLIVEDDKALGDALSRALERRGYLNDRAARLDDARQMLAAASYGALLLDLGLPDGDGIDLVRRLRAGQDTIPIIAITARDAIGNRIAGLDAGADDYIVKPFDMDELVARLGAVLRRQGSFAGRELTLGNLTFDLVSGDVVVEDRRLTLSARERQLVELLMRRAGQLVSKHLAEDQLFGLTQPPGSNAIEVYIHRLRRKLEAAGASAEIETVRGLGYLIRPKQ